MKFPNSTSLRHFVALQGLVLMLVAPLCSSEVSKEKTPDSISASMVTLRQGDLAIEVALPDHENGFYQSTRFDHGGIVTAATWRGHSFFGTLKQPRKPKVHDGASGAPEEFDLNYPPGYEQAAPGEPFLKIGVGVLIRKDREDYKFFTPFTVAEWAKWTVTQDAESISCTQSSGTPTYACRETRTIRLHPDGNGFTITRTLTNTGSADLVTEQYNHCMITIDGDPIGPDYRITTAGPATVSHRLLQAEGRDIAIVDPLPPRKSIWTILGGLPPGADGTAVTVSNLQRNVAVTIASDCQPDRVVIYGEVTAICPEIFSAFSIPPGEERQWSQTFTFSEIPQTAVPPDQTTPP